MLRGIMRTAVVAASLTSGLLLATAGIGGNASAAIRMSAAETAYPNVGLVATTISMSISSVPYYYSPNSGCSVGTGLDAGAVYCPERDVTYHITIAPTDLALDGPALGLGLFSNGTVTIQYAATDDSGSCGPYACKYLKLTIPVPSSCLQPVQTCSFTADYANSGIKTIEEEPDGYLFANGETDSFQATYSGDGISSGSSTPYFLAAF